MYKSDRSANKDLLLPDTTVCYGMSAPPALSDPEAAIQKALNAPINSKPLSVIAKEKLDANKDATAVIVISDNTRPVPYKGKGNILVPILTTLLETGYKSRHITVLIATGTHRPMTAEEIERIIDPWVFESGIAVVNHDCKDESILTYLGKTERGSEVHINSRYVDADLKILTGLVESHFMAVLRRAQVSVQGSSASGGPSSSMGRI